MAAWYDDYYEKNPPHSTWGYKRCWLPRRSKQSKKLIWFAKAYRREYTIYKPDLAIVMYTCVEWYTEEEYIWNTLKS